MLKRLLGVVSGLAVFCFLAWFLVDKVVIDDPDVADNNQRLSELASNGTDARSAEEPLDLALKTIDLSQGEGGFEIWRLKAEWANVHKQGDLIRVDRPRLTYFSRDENGKPLYVSSDAGDIHQKTQILRFVNNVRIMQENKVIVGDLLVYDGSDKTMTLPDGGDFSDTGLKGSAKQIVWHINEKIIQAAGNVQVDFEDSEEAAGSAKRVAPDHPESE